MFLSKTNKEKESMSSPSTYSSSQTLIPGLPNDIATQILSSLPLPYQSTLLPTSKPIHSLLSSSFPFHLRRLLRLHSDLLCLFPSNPLTPPLLFCPQTLLFHPLPPLPVSPFFFHLSNFVSVFLYPHLYVLGGSHFDARSFPLNHPLPSSSVFRLDVTTRTMSWDRVADMNIPRGSFACAADEGRRKIMVAGGGSRHVMYPMEGSRIESVEVFDVEKGQWEVKKGMGRRRAGGVGFIRRGKEFWVMGGYDEYRRVGGVVPSDVFCRDGMVMGLGTGEWTEVAEMWGEGERRKLGKVVVFEDGDGELHVFMLDHRQIFRYEFAANRWLKETNLHRKIAADDNCCFVAMNGELFVLTSEPRLSLKKKQAIVIQVYNLNTKKWRLLSTSLPLNHPIDFKTAISCTVKL